MKALSTYFDRTKVHVSLAVMSSEFFFLRGEAQTSEEESAYVSCVVNMMFSFLVSNLPQNNVSKPISVSNDDRFENDPRHSICWTIRLRPERRHHGSEEDCRVVMKIRR